MRTAYFFDSYEFTRWFDDDLLWNMIPGDVTQIPPVPSIVKSRPIAGDNANSVLLNLDKFRHFVFLKDAIPFRDKEPRAIFRCAINCHHPNHHLRRRFMERYYGSACCDAGISNRHPSLPPEWTVPHISMYDHLRYRYILAIEGNDVATNLKWVMSTNSLAVMPRPTYETWFMEGRSARTTTTSRSGPITPIWRSACTTTTPIPGRPRRSSPMPMPISTASATHGARS